MENKSLSKPEEKPFSVLERFRQLKKEKEQTAEPEKAIKTPETAGTVFQATTSSHNPPNGEFGRDDFRSGRGRLSGKRNFNDTSAEKIATDFQHNKKISADLHFGQKESDVGIVEFISNCPGFSGILKHRYTDFHVNEIDTEGRVIKLTSTEIPVDDSISEPLSEEEDPSIMAPEQWAMLKEIVEKDMSSTVDIDVTDLSKDKRQRMHKAVKRRFGISVFSNTNIIKDRKIMQIGCATGQPNHRFCRWPKERPEFLHFVLFKENTDMTEAINVISRFTFIKANKFGYAGTKDKRAVTTQQVCVRKGGVERFKSCSKLRGMAVGNYSYRWNKLRLGDLSGNRFRIVLRHVKASDDVIQEAIEVFQKKGFINYFGLQRFGSSALVPTYFVGKAILKKDWKLAIEYILKPRPGESCFRDVKEAREVWWNTKDVSEALKPLTRKDKSIEGKILLGLKKHGPKAYQNAFDELPTQTVTMYLHSYQSLIWNKVVSRRIKEFGLNVLPGDLVRVPSWMADDREAKSKENKSDSEDDDESEDDGFNLRIQVRALSAEEAVSVSIYDVLYPLPGDGIRFPDNEVAKWYTEFLEQDGHSMECFHNANKRYGMYGSYRQMLEMAEDFSWRTMHYSNPDEDLLLSDLEVLRGKPPPVLDPEGSYKAVILEFNLKVCSYATMAMRELAKCETSNSSQALLTKQAREEDQVTKKQKLEVEQELDQNMEIELVPDNKNFDSHSKKQNKNCGMEIEQIVPVTLEQNQTVSSEADEEGEMNKREAEADNIINKYLESNYH